MSNRRNMTRVQRVWRKVRKLSTTELMVGEKRVRMLNERGQQIFFWRPDEVMTEIVNIRLIGGRPTIYARHYHRAAAIRDRRE